MSYFLGIEIGGTKLQLGVGADDGVLAGSVARLRGCGRRAGRHSPADHPSRAGVAGKGQHRPFPLRGVGIGFGGPVDDATRTVIKSHQIEGWDNFPLANWVSEVVGLPAALGNDADVAGLAEALHGAGKGLSPIFYITIGSGIGGGFIIDGEIYRGVGKGAAEIGHLIVDYPSDVPMILEEAASGWAIDQNARARLSREPNGGLDRGGGEPGRSRRAEDFVGRLGSFSGRHSQRRRPAVSAPDRYRRRRFPDGRGVAV